MTGREREREREGERRGRKEKQRGWKEKLDSELTLNICKQADRSMKHL